MKNLGAKTKSFMGQCKRVWQLLRKPSALEFKTVSKVAAIGIAIIGLIGFVIAMIMNLLLP